MDLEDIVTVEAARNQGWREGCVRRGQEKGDIKFWPEHLEERLSPSLNGKPKVLGVHGGLFFGLDTGEVTMELKRGLCVGEGPPKELRPGTQHPQEGPGAGGGMYLQHRMPGRSGSGVHGPGKGAPRACAGPPCSAATAASLLTSALLSALVSKVSAWGNRTSGKNRPGPGATSFNWASGL